MTHFVPSAWIEWFPTSALVLGLLPLWLISWPPSLSIRHSYLFSPPLPDLGLCVSVTAYPPVLTILSGGQSSHLLCTPRTYCETWWRDRDLPNACRIKELIWAWPTWKIWQWFRFVRKEPLGQRWHDMGVRAVDNSKSFWRHKKIFVILPTPSLRNSHFIFILMIAYIFVTQGKLSKGTEENGSFTVVCSN